jgi:hypothetical protein
VAQPADHRPGSIPVIFAAAFILLPCLIFVGARLALPGDGTQIVLDFSRANLTGLMVNPLNAPPGGLVSGDIVLTIAERPLESWLAGVLSGHWTTPAGATAEPLLYTASRNGQEQAVTVHLAAFPLSSALADKWGVFLFLIYLQLISLFVFIRRPHLPGARLFLLVSSVAFSNGVVFNLGLQASDLRYSWLVALWLVQAIILDGFILAGLLHLSLVFPWRQTILTRHPAILGWVYLGLWLVYLAYVTLSWGLASTATARFLLLIRGTTVTSIVYFCLVLGSWLQSYRTSPGPVERRQIGWILWGMVMALAPFIGLSLLPALLSVDAPLGANFTLIGVFLCAIPTTCTIAILRERLFDIDIIINRTLVYGALTVTLALVYLVGVALFQQFFRFLTGQDSDLAVIASTLAIATLFTPLRRRIQLTIDRRFYRRKYDAALTLTTFSTTLRNDAYADLDQLSEALIMVVQETMQPTHVSLWLTPSKPRSNSDNL